MLGASGERFARAYDVQDPSKPLKVTLAWTDAPGAVDANPALVNDLDLVVRQGGRTYKGNVFAGGRSITGGDADRRNNLESVTLPQATGRFSVEVLGTNIAGNGVPGRRRRDRSGLRARCLERAGSAEPGAGARSGGAVRFGRRRRRLARAG